MKMMGPTATLLMLMTCSVSAHAATPIPGACTDDFNSDLRQSIDGALWEPDRWPGGESLCGARPELLTPTAEGLGFLLQDVADARHGCGYAGLRSRQYYGYGSFSVRLKAPIHPGETAAFFLINRWTPKDWHQKEIDIEFLGKDRHGVQFNVHDQINGQGNQAGQPQWVPLDFDIGDAFHVYGIRWSADAVAWTVDGKDVAGTQAQVPDEPWL